MCNIVFNKIMFVNSSKVRQALQLEITSLIGSQIILMQFEIFYGYWKCKAICDDLKKWATQGVIGMMTALNTIK